MYFFFPHAFSLCWTAPPEQTTNSSTMHGLECPVTFVCSRQRPALSWSLVGQHTSKCVIYSFLSPSYALLSSSSRWRVALVVSSYVTHLILWICEFNSCQCQQRLWGVGFFFFWQAGITHQSHGSFVWKMLVLEKVDLSAQHCMVLACSTTKDKCSFQ